MNNDLISRSELKKALTSNCKPELCHDYNTAWCDHCCRTHDFEDLIDNAPTVDLWQMRQEATENALKKAEVLYGRPQGEWLVVGHDDTTYWYRCSICEHEEHDNFTKHYHYCPNCGAKMKNETF